MIIRKIIKRVFPNENKRLELIENKLNLIENELNLIKFAIGDQNGMGKLLLMMNNAKIPKKYEYIFLKMKKDDVYVDCGANIGLIIDIAKHQQGKIYAFEPNKNLFTFLKQKYSENQEIQIYEKAVYNKDGEIEFNTPSNENEDYISCSWCGSISTIENLDKFVKNFKKKNVVETVNFSKFIKEKIFSKEKEIYLLKIDIEGVEFEVINNIIENNLYSKIKYIVCETHERFFNDGKEKLEKLEKLIKEKNIKNIFLDWI
ncbi:MAG: FkbM family methyltransferase [bacterium]